MTERIKKQVAPVNAVWNGDIILDAPVDVAWSYIVDYPRWQNYSNVEHIAGRPGHEGEIVLLKKEEQGFEFPPYYARIVKLDPGRRIMWKTYPTKDEKGDFFGFVEFVARPEGEKTRFEYRVIYEFDVPYDNEDELKAFQSGQYDNFGVLFASVLPKLQRLVSERG